MNNKKIVFLIMILWTSIVLFWVIQNEYIRAVGREILLETVPIDPKDLFMGDYVILNYKIANNYHYSNYPLNSTIYTVLKINNKNIAEIDYVSDTKPNGKELFLKCKVQKCSHLNFWRRGTCCKYGIESYYVKEHTGLDLENNLRQGALVKVRIDKNGIGKVVGFKNNG